MAKIEIIIKDSSGEELTRLQSIDLELGSQSLDEIDSNSHYDNDNHYFRDLSSIKPNSFVIRLNFAVKFII